MPPHDALSDCVDVYYQYCHMQPLWLFDHDELSPIQDCPEEIILSLLALSLCHSRHAFFHGRSEDLSRRYAQLAREQIMLIIAQGKVTLATVQSLCMLALANFQMNDLHLLELHISIATSFSKCAGLDFESHSNEASLHKEARRRVFWSLNLLNQTYGQHGSMVNILHDVEHPQYVAVQPDLRKTSNLLPPSMPQEPTPGGEGRKDGIWAYMVQLSTLWREVRMYVMQCAHTNSEPPWSVDSGYAVISAHLMNLETKFPTCHRYDAARFFDRGEEELEQNRAYWTPWLYIQFTYHTIHNMLNHPFLYSSRPQQPDQLAVPNTFWKTSSDSAFIHATWIARLVDLVTEKSYRIGDPFIGYCVAVAATVHIFFSQAADDKIREATQTKLEACLAFVEKLASSWPCCRLLYNGLQTLIHSAFTVTRSSSAQEFPRRTISINTRLMWRILQNNLDNTHSHLPSHRLFHESFCRDTDDTDTDHDEHTVETQIFHSPNAEVDISNGGQALPPRATAKIVSYPQGPLQLDEQVASSLTRTVSTLRAPLVDSASAPWVVPSAFPTLDMTYDPFYQFQDPGTPFIGSWEVGNF